MATHHWHLISESPRSGGPGRYPEAVSDSVYLSEVPGRDSLFDIVTLDQPVVVVAGLPGGTEAAGELMAGPSFIKSLLGSTSRDWKTVNLEAEVATRDLRAMPVSPTSSPWNTVARPTVPSKLGIEDQYARYWCESCWCQVEMVVAHIW